MSCCGNKDKCSLPIFAEKLLAWWKENKRDFSWRKVRDPYKILLAEILLRKTTAKQVERVYERFLQKFPSLEALSKASEEEVRGILTHLGMEHKRVKLLLEIGKILMERHRGRVPSRPEEIIALPGVGRYAANAVLCLAHGEDAPMVDTNVVRIVQRAFGFKSSRARAKDDPQLWEFVGALIPPGRGREFNLALLDLAATICTPMTSKSLQTIQRICSTGWYARNGYSE